MSTMTNEAFAEHARRERLTTIWRATFVIASAALWLYLLSNGFGHIQFPLDALMAWGIALGAAYGCRGLLRREQTASATWLYVLGIQTVLAYILWVGSTDVRQVAPYTTLLLIYLAGVMLPARSLGTLLAINTLLILGVPYLADETLPTYDTVMAVVLTVGAAALSLQSSGELYSIAMWAIENYRMQRQSADELFDSRQDIEQMLTRQQALTTQLQQTNVELARARAAADEANRTRGAFLANMSHELRTPLNAIIGFSDTILNYPMMYQSADLPEPYHADIAQIHYSGRHLLNIINDILDLSKIDAGRLDIKPEVIDLKPIIEATLAVAVGLVKDKHLKLQHDIPNTYPQVCADPVRVRQVLLNLYSNAAKFTDEGSIMLKLTYDTHYITLAVADTGVGIPPESIENIFDEFSQTAAGAKKMGTGLGLAICRRLLHMMGGEIWAESTVGKGSTFFLTLPIYAKAQAENMLMDTYEKRETHEHSLH